MAAEEGEVAVAAEGVGGAFGYLGGLAEGAAALAPTAGEVAGAMAATVGVGAAATAVGRGTRRRRSLGAGEHALPASAEQQGRGRAGRPVRQQHERRHAAPALHAPAAAPQAAPQAARLLAVWLQRPGADQSHAPPLLLGPEPSDSASVPADSRASSQGGGLDSPSPYERK